VRMFSKIRTRSASQISQEIRDRKTAITGLESENAALIEQIDAMADAADRLCLAACDDKTINLDEELKRSEETTADVNRRVRKNCRLIEAHHQKLGGLRLELEEAEADADRDRFHKGSKSIIATAERFEPAAQSLFTVLDEILEQGKNSDEVLPRLKLRDADAFKLQHDNLAAALGYLLRQARLRYGVTPIDYSSHARSFAEFILLRYDALRRDLEARNTSQKESSEVIDDDHGSGDAPQGLAEGPAS
jgi:hypothetical protein